MARNPPWTREELILALELYLRDGQRGPEHSDVVALSASLRGLAGPGVAPNYRNPDSVAMKLANFAAVDPSHSGVGLPRGNRLDRVVFDEFAQDPQRLSQIATGIQDFGQMGLLENPEPELEELEAPEGRLLYRLHRKVERDRRLVTRKKRSAAKAGPLRCEVCGFDFGATYGQRGVGYIECHHTTPLSSSGPVVTSTRDLALVCSNCHRMLHRGPSWLSPMALGTLIATTPPVDGQ